MRIKQDKVYGSIKYSTHFIEFFQKSKEWQNRHSQKKELLFLMQRKKCTVYKQILCLPNHQFRRGNARLSSHYIYPGLPLPTDTISKTNRYGSSTGTSHCIEHSTEKFIHLQQLEGCYLLLGVAGSCESLKTKPLCSEQQIREALFRRIS